MKKEIIDNIIHNEEIAEIIEKDFDRNEPQTFTWEIDDFEESYQVSHTLKPLSDERFFDFSLENEKTLKRTTKPDWAMLNPHKALWNDLVESVEGYEDAADWKEQMFDNDCVDAVNFMLKVDVPKSDAKPKRVRSFNQHTTIKLVAGYGRRVFTGLEITFRRASQAERTLWLQVNSGADEQIASAVEISRAEKLNRIARKLFVSASGYKNGDVPAWHLNRAAFEYFDILENQLGKHLKL